jgi:hypothetical protein
MQREEYAIFQDIIVPLSFPVKQISCMAMPVLIPFWDMSVMYDSPCVLMDLHLRAP